jgi:hypothetical protein
MTLQGVIPRTLGGARSEQTTRVDLEHYRALALELGASGAARIPVILDTDIGTDIDDTWALAMLLKSPELDAKLVVSDSGDTAQAVFAAPWDVTITPLDTCGIVRLEEKKVPRGARRR